MWKGSMFSEWNGEQFPSAWKITDLVEVKYYWCSFKYYQTLALRKKCPNTEFFLVRIFQHSDQKKLRIWTLFTQCNCTEVLRISHESAFGSKQIIADKSYYRY